MSKLTQTAGKVATSTIGALKSTPALLAVIILNCIFLTVMYFAVTASRDRQAREFELIMARCYGTPSK